MISVVVPVYNTAPFVSGCLDSLLGQSYRDLEIICVNDGSTDDSAAILDAYAAKDTRIRVIHQENAGVSEARNRGLALAKGDIIGFCDADDAYVPGALECVVGAFESAEYEIVVTGFYAEGKDGAGTGRCVPEAFSCTARELQERMLYQDCIMGSVCNKFFKRACVSGGKFDTRLTHCEDMLFVSSVLSRSPEMPVLILPCISYEYHYNKTSATVNPARLLDSQGRLRYLAALDEILRLYPGSWSMWLLVRSAQFCLVEENIDKFVESLQVLRRMARQSLRYAVAYVVCRKRCPLRERLLRLWHVVKCLGPR